MNRRNFIKGLMIGAGLVVTQTAEVFAATAKKIRLAAKVGVLGFKLEPPAPAAKANKKCETCTYFQQPLPGQDKKTTEGLCTLGAMKSAMKAEEVVVKAPNYCNMWKKK